VNAEVTFNDAEFQRMLGDTARKILIGLTQDFERRWQMLLRQPKHGRFYRVSKTGAKHRASAPGEAPAARSGAAGLSGGFQKEFETPTETSMESIVGDSLPYSEFLEFGTSKMAARPSWIPALMQTSRDADNTMIKVSVQTDI
jgi:HK97 gp10 family phage protein